MKRIDTESGRNAMANHYATRRRFAGMKGSSRILVLCGIGRFPLVPGLGGFILGAIYAVLGRSKVIFADGGLTTEVFCGQDDVEEED